jgi:hypothetical protein
MVGLMVGLLGALLMAGCGSRMAAAPPLDAVLKRYAAALEQERFDEAYRMMSDAFRKRYTRDQFVSLLREDPEWLRRNLKRLRSSPQRVLVQARVEYGDGDAMKLVEEGGAWRIATDPTEFYSQRTPAEALRSFVRAIERKRYDVVLRFVPAKWAGSMTIEKLRKVWDGSKRQEVVTLLKHLKANLEAPIQQSGDRASMPYGGKFEVRFVREDGIWKIEDPD